MAAGDATNRSDVNYVRALNARFNTENQKMNNCYISDDFIKFQDKIPAYAIICPEGVKNEQQLLEWIEDTRNNPQTFFTNSLFVLRELHVRQIPTRFVNIRNDGTEEADNIDDVGAIAILDMELRQSDRYMDFEMVFSKEHK